MSAGVAVGSSTTAVPYERWLAQADDLRGQFTAGTPTPHLVLDGFLDDAIAEEAMEAFPPPGDGWIHYLHYNERTFGLNDPSLLPAPLRAIVDELNAPRFVELLGALTGLDALRADDQLEGGGLHQSERGGYLHMHADFTVHPHRPTWRRSLNLLIYLNPGWQDEWGGHLELWDPQMQRCVQRIAPVFNRAVLFQTHERSYHGFPEPIRCPSDVTRKAFALYYFCEETVPPRAIATNYRPRPDDGPWKRAMIAGDVAALRLYDGAKRRFGLDDALANRLLRWLAGR